MLFGFFYTAYPILMKTVMFYLSIMRMKYISLFNIHAYELSTDISWKHGEMHVRWIEYCIAFVGFMLRDTLLRKHIYAAGAQAFPRLVSKSIFSLCTCVQKLELVPNKRNNIYILDKKWIHKHFYKYKYFRIIYDTYLSI